MTLSLLQALSFAEIEENRKRTGRHDHGRRCWIVFWVVEGRRHRWKSAVVKRGVPIDRNPFRREFFRLFLSVFRIVFVVRVGKREIGWARVGAKKKNGRGKSRNFFGFSHTRT